MSTENRAKAKKTKNDLLMGILVSHIGIDRFKLLLKENKYTEACKKIDEHYKV